MTNLSERIKAYRTEHECSMQEAKRTVMKADRIARLTKLQRQTYRHNVDVREILENVIGDMIAEAEAA